MKLFQQKWGKVGTEGLYTLKELSRIIIGQVC